MRYSSKLSFTVLAAFILSGCHARSPAAPAHNSYSTNFPLTENPISEGGKWVNGGTTGLDWTNIRTNANVEAYGTNSGTNPGYDDSTAVLQNIGFTWGPNQISTGTVYLNGNSNVQDPEVELRLNVTIAAHSITGYMCNFSAKNDGTQYFGFGRWNGAYGDFTGLLPGGGTITPSPILHNGDVVSCMRIGNTISAYINGTLICGNLSAGGTGCAQVTDSTYLGGSPGISTNIDGNGGTGGGINGTFGFSSFSASDDAGGIVPASTE